MNILEKFRWTTMKKKLAGFYQRRQAAQVSEAEIQKEIALYDQMAQFYQKHLYDKAVPNAEIFLMESYRAAAMLGDLKSQYQLSDLLLKKALFWCELQTTPYRCKIHEKYASQLFEEALIYLKSADEKDYPLAKRLYGLAHIHGWGMSPDRDKGFQLVIDSIGLDNAWDRSMKIFEELGLNKPEFFSYMMSVKKK